MFSYNFFKPATIKAHMKKKQKYQNHKLLKKRMETIREANALASFNQIKKKQIVNGTHNLDTSKKCANMKVDKNRRATMMVPTRYITIFNPFYIELQKKRKCKKGRL